MHKPQVGLVIGGSFITCPIPTLSSLLSCLQRILQAGHIVGRKFCDPFPLLTALSHLRRWFSQSSVSLIARRFPQGHSCRFRGVSTALDPFTTHQMPHTHPCSSCLSILSSTTGSPHLALTGGFVASPTVICGCHVSSISLGALLFFIF